MSEHARQFGKAVPDLAAEVWSLLLSHPWLGNVRELENTVGTIFSWAKTGGADLGKLRSYLHPEPLLPSASRDPESLPHGGLRFGKPEKAATVEELRRAGGNVARAARALGVTRQAVHYRIRNWGLSNPR
jgi:transcriptional regulator with PAS, ATPase and Fis domain